MTGVTSLKSVRALSRQPPRHNNSKMPPASQLHLRAGFSTLKRIFLPSSPTGLSVFFNPCNKDPCFQCYSQQTSKSRATWPKMIISFKVIATPKSPVSPPLTNLLYREGIWGHLLAPPAIPHAVHLRLCLRLPVPRELSASAFQKGASHT